MKVPRHSRLFFSVGDTRWHLLSIEEQASMVPSLDYGEPKTDNWLYRLYSSQLNRPPGAKSQASGFFPLLPLLSMRLPA